MKLLSWLIEYIGTGAGNYEALALGLPRFLPDLWLLIMVDALVDLVELTLGVQGVIFSEASSSSLTKLICSIYSV
jgi:hypothetical protein